MFPTVQALRNEPLVLIFPDQSSKKKPGMVGQIGWNLSQVLLASRDAWNAARFFPGTISCLALITGGRLAGQGLVRALAKRLFLLIQRFPDDS
jgi:hypothetical protein